MTRRRDVLVGLGCLGTLAAAEALRPRRELVLMPSGRALADLIPPQFPGWTTGGDGEVVVPRTEGSLQSRLYSQELARNYRAVGAPEQSLPVMLLAAYGATQSDALQLHRPEVCYPASGFEVSVPRPIELMLGAAVVPAVALTATFGPRIEDVVYWTRLGDALPRSEGEQRRVRLAAALRGFVGDGVLIRASAIRQAADLPRFAELDAFFAALVGNLTDQGRVVLLGPGLAGRATAS